VGVVLAADAEYLVGLVEDLLGDDRRVVLLRFVPALAVEDFAEIGPVAEDDEDRCG